MSEPLSGDLITLLQTVGGWDGFEVDGVTTEDSLAPDAVGLPAPRLIIALRPKADHVKRCGRCGGAVAAVHETTTRRVRDLPVMQ